MLQAMFNSGAVTALAAGGYAYAAMVPSSQLFGATLIAGNDPAQFALTYDDGPNDPDTLRLLDVLAHHQVHATFFLIGRFVRQRPKIARAIADAGHLVGNHTMTHPLLVLRPPAEVRWELAECNSAIEDVIGAPVRYFRPPHGGRRPDVLRAARELGLTPVMWNAMGYDWKPMQAEQVLANVEKDIARNQLRKRGSNILLHDGGQAGIGQDRMHTVKATALLLEKYTAADAGIRFVTPAVWG